MSLKSMLDPKMCDAGSSSSIQTETLWWPSCFANKWGFTYGSPLDLLPFKICMFHSSQVIEAGQSNTVNHVFVKADIRFGDSYDKKDCVKK